MIFMLAALSWVLWSLSAPSWVWVCLFLGSLYVFE